MADNTLAHRAQNATRTETMHLPPTAAPTNHGKTVAAWVTTYVVVIAFTIAGSRRAVRDGLALLGRHWACSSPASWSARCCRSSGYGQGGAKTLARQARTGGH